MIVCIAGLDVKGVPKKLVGGIKVRVIGHVLRFDHSVRRIDARYSTQEAPHHCGNGCTQFHFVKTVYTYHKHSSDR